MGLLHKVLGYFGLVARFCGLRQRLQSCGGWGLWVAGYARLLWVFLGCNSSGAQSQKMAAQEALVEALSQPKKLNLHHVIMLRGYESRMKNKIKMLVIPIVILSNVFGVASTATKMPIHQHWYIWNFA